jgi:drug/metabolite transporter (DMT)-like permease
VTTAPRTVASTRAGTPVWVALGIVYVVWGSTYLAIRVAVAPSHGTGLPPLLMAGVRFTIAGLLMLALFGRRPAADGRPDRLGPRQWLASGIVGSALLLGGNGPVSVGEQHLASGTAALIVGCSPIFAGLLAAAIGRERFTWQRAAGLAVGLAGIAVLSVGTGSGHDTVGGVLVVIAASASWSAGSVYAMGAPLPRRPLVGTGMEMLTGGLVSLVVSAASGEWSGLTLGQVPGRSWAALAYLIVIGSMIAYTAYAWLLSNARLSLTMTYAYVNPVVAVILGFLILGEPLTARTGIASALVVAGIALVVSRRRRSAPGAAAEAAPATETPTHPVADPHRPSPAPISVSDEFCESRP